MSFEDMFYAGLEGCQDSPLVAGAGCIDGGRPAMEKRADDAKLSGTVEYGIGL